MNAPPASPAPNPPLAAGTASQNRQPSMGRAILTDGHFWVPVVVLTLGILLLIVLSRMP